MTKWKTARLCIFTFQNIFVREEREVHMEKNFANMKDGVLAAKVK